jgi:alkanesulfonate monooxygenase SsuD/methylene tetrahydromethanopterin reductase-like flavin-dependent oxidoreductase (luciferase family)
MAHQPVYALRRQGAGALHVFLRRQTARAQVSALSVVQLPECFGRIRSVDLQGAQRQSTRLRAEASADEFTVFVDVEVLIERDVRVAMRAAEHLGPNASDTGSVLRYVGTPRGLAGFIADVHTLGIADGVTLLPLRPADNADRIINDVLPMLGLDVARLSA